MCKLSRDFYLCDAVTLARKLIGKKLMRQTPDGITGGIIVETEAYMGTLDKAAHTYGGKPTKRTEIVFEEGGRAYIYLIYGMYSCLNIVANTKDKAECVLIRALMPTDGVELMSDRRGTNKLQNLCSGPGKLCRALSINRHDNGLDLCGDELWLEACDPDENIEIHASKRINIDYAEEAADYPWRFTLGKSMYLSAREKSDV